MNFFTVKKLVIEPSKIKTGFIIAAAILLLGVWMRFSVQTALPALWGPYVMPLVDCGPLFFSRLGVLMVITGPLMALLIPLLNSQTLIQWAIMQTAAGAMYAATLLAFGNYVHNIVHLQGVDHSLEYLAGEVGFDSVEAVPDHIKKAFALSNQLAEEGKAPWKPMQWKEATWPEIPAPTGLK